MANFTISTNCNNYKNQFKNSRLLNFAVVKNFSIFLTFGIAKLKFPKKYIAYKTQPI